MCNRSKFFDAACRWPSKIVRDAPESDSPHHTTDQNPGDDDVKIVDLDDDDPVAVWALVQYLYHLEYPTPTDDLVWEVLKLEEEGEPYNEDPEEFPASSTWGCLFRQAKIYILAEKYGLPGLKSLARRNFEEGITGAFGGTTEDVIGCVREVYTATPEDDRGLRDLLISTLTKDPELVISWNEGDKPEGEDLLAEVPQLALELIRGLHHRFHDRRNQVHRRP